MAKGTLFGGYRVWVPDEQGNPLHVGRVSFYVAGSSTPAEVYKDKELSVSWGTTVSVDAHGFVGNSENGVWLSHEHLYKVVVERKVCEDPVTWETVSTTDNVGEIDEQEATPADPYQRFSVDTISALKQVNPSVYPIVYVNGWMEKDDCGEPMQFRWQSGEQHSSDDGHWVNTSYSGAETGCWEQIFEDGDIDVRKFGAIPDSDLTVDNAVRNALRFCTEPHVYTVDDPVRLPRTLKFVKEGFYLLSSTLDFTIYTTNSNNGSKTVPVIIYGGVCFTSETSVTVKFSKTTTILSKDKVVGGSVVPSFTEMDYVYTGWFGTQYGLGKSFILVPYGNESTFRSYSNCIVLNLNESSLFAKTFYAGDLKLDESGISVGGTVIFNFTDGTAKFEMPAYFSSLSVTNSSGTSISVDGESISFSGDGSKTKITKNSVKTDEIDASLITVKSLLTDEMKSCISMGKYVLIIKESSTWYIRKYVNGSWENVRSFDTKTVEFEWGDFTGYTEWNILVAVDDIVINLPNYNEGDEKNLIFNFPSGNSAHEIYDGEGNTVCELGIGGLLSKRDGKVVVRHNTGNYPIDTTSEWFIDPFAL